MMGLMRDTVLDNLVNASLQRGSSFPAQETPYWQHSDNRERQGDTSTNGLAAGHRVDDFHLPEKAALVRPGLKRRVTTAKEPIPRLSGDTLDIVECGSVEGLVTWDGPDDPENPLNFSPGKKAFVSFEIFILNSFLYLGSSIYSAAIPGIMQEFHVSQLVATLGTSLSIMGYATGPMIWSPLSEAPKLGRNTIYIATMAVFILLQFPIVFASNIETILIFRFLTSFFGSPAQATGGATIADMYLPRDRSYGLGLWELSTWIGPTLGPLVGGFAVQARGWRWAMWELIWVNAPIMLFMFCFLPETSASNILYRKAKRLRQSTGIQSLKCEVELRPQRVAGGGIVHETIIRPWVLCFQEPICLLLNAYTALICILLFAWLESFPIVFGGVYGFDQGEVGLAFLGPLAGSILATLIFFVWFRLTQSKNFDDRGRRKPEERFVPLMAGCFFIPASLFMFGWGARRDIHWIVPIIGSGLFSIGGFSLFISILNYLPDAYPDHAASVLAGNNFVRCILGSACVLGAAPLYNHLGHDWASTLSGLLACGFVPVPFLFYFFGDRIRRASKHARKDF